MGPKSVLSVLVLVAACSHGAAGGGNGDAGPVGPPPDAPLAACQAADPGGFTFEKIATWADDAKAAYTFIHDDFCGADLHGIQENAEPLMDSFGIHGGVGAIAGECDDNDAWSLTTDAESRGTEVVDHSYTHVPITPDNVQHEVIDAQAAFTQHLGHPTTFFIYPYDYFTAATIAAVGAAGHLGSRAGNRDDNDGLTNPPINGADPTNDLEVEFDVWPREYSKYSLFYPEDILLEHVYDAIKKGGWAMREFHSVMTDGADPTMNGFGPITVSQYKKHLQFLADAWTKGVLWTAPPSTVIKYRHARTACTATVANDTIHFDTSNPDCVKYATPISVIVTTGQDVPRVEATQGGAEVWSRKLGPGRFSVSADPTKGDVALSGCANPGHEVDPNVQLPAEPTPAASVCDIETVHGTGSPGKMDDLERPVAEFQTLPNPSQADGRTGTWSWYPQNASVSVQAEGSNHFVRYSGSGLAAWSGVTLAFLGGNGAGSCYDGTAYHGIRFKIRGTVNATDTLAGKVVISIVTAETQSRAYGGDLAGSGGHFNQIVTLSPTWQTVTINWGDLAKPTWGDTANLTAVATGKLQAIDFGVTNAASTFQIDIDDVEMQ